MSKLIVPSQQPNQEKSVVKVTPESANWGYVGFEVYTLAKGDKISMDTGEQEVCIVLQRVCQRENKAAGVEQHRAAHAHFRRNPALCRLRAIWRSV